MGKPVAKPDSAKAARSLHAAEKEAGLHQPDENRGGLTNPGVEPSKNEDKGVFGGEAEKATPKANEPSIADKVAEAPTQNWSVDDFDFPEQSIPSPSTVDTTRESRIQSMQQLIDDLKHLREGEQPARLSKKDDSVLDADLSTKITMQNKTIKETYEKYGYEPVVTSANDYPDHKTDSKHYSNEAIDIRGNNMSVATMRAVAKELGEKLGDDYDVLAEVFNVKDYNHIHIEYDPK